MHLLRCGRAGKECRASAIVGQFPASWRLRCASGSAAGTGDSSALRVCVLGSGSRGNATFVATGRVRVLFDAGFSCRQIQLRLAAIGEDFKALDAVVISHEHSDHVQGLAVLARRTGVRVYMTRLTQGVLRGGPPETEIVHFQAGDGFSVEDLDIETFTISHDAIDPVGFCVRRKDCKLGIATDLGYVTDSVRHHLRGSDMIVLESNHDLEMLKAGPYPWELKQRVMSRSGHLSNTAVAEFLSRDWDRRSRAIVLAHLSENNNLPVIAEMDAREALEGVGAGSTDLCVASQGKPTPVFRL